jgi:uncharacterized protein (DUF58 family)
MNAAAQAGGFILPTRAPPPAWKRRLVFTRAGRWYTALTVGIGLAAINTGNNLLFLVLGLLLASIVVSGILSEQSLKGIRLERRLPVSATAGEPVLIGIVARNLKKRGPSFSLELRERNGDVAGRGFLIFLAAGETAETSYRFTPARRGAFAFEELEVATKAPFGLFEKSRPIGAPAELIVFPRKVAAPHGEVRSLSHEGERPEDRAGLGLELHSLRDHRPGEDARSIHWRSTARHGRLIGVDREQERRPRVCVVFDHRPYDGDPLERAVERAAAVVTREIESGADVSLAVSGANLPARSGEGQLREALRMLALLKPAGAGMPPPRADPAAAVLEVA